MSPIEATNNKLEKYIENLRLTEESSVKTIFERILSIYVRGKDPCDTYHIDIKGCHYSRLEPKILECDAKVSVNLMKKIDIVEADSRKFIAWEYSEDNVTVGILTEYFIHDEFDSWFLGLVSKTAKVKFSNKEKSPLPSELEYNNITEKIKKEFVGSLKYTTKNDLWEQEGNKFFHEKVNFFTSKMHTIEAVLPAFPCKSSNFNKVATWKPDKGEELALRRLISFAKNVKLIYPPGIKLWIVSDGHVFSDCIGVDDQVVDQYSEELKKLYDRLNVDGTDCIEFKSLKEIFDTINSSFETSLVDGIVLEQLLETRVDAESNICRKILAHSCDTDSGELRRDIKTLDHPRLLLFRGFSKFMEDDLMNHPNLMNLSTKKFKKMISRIAFEMIKRNDAYSNLVEVMFPFHLRFSIHAHSNCGPKFGIRLLESKSCKPINSLDDCLSSDYNHFLHIPTPWHNCVLRYSKSDLYYVTKSEVVKRALEEGSHICEWNPLEKYFFISKSTH